MKTKIGLVLLSLIIIVTFTGFATNAWFVSQQSTSNNTIETGNIEIITVGNTNPDPLLRIDGKWAIAGSTKWYPGAECYERRWTIGLKDSSLPALLYGISAETSNFIVPNNYKYSMEQLKKDFEENFILTVVLRNYGVEKELFKGNLSQIKNIKSFNIVSADKEYFTLNTTKEQIDIYIKAKLSETADNSLQGINGNVKIKLHATQTNMPLDQLTNIK